MKKKLCLIYQLFTKCNINCKYCYNNFEQDVLPYNHYTSKVSKLLELCHDETCFVLNGGEPLLLKDFDKLVNMATEKTKTYSYTNGTLGTLHYKKFLERLNYKDNLYMTISLHFKEVLIDNKLPDKYIRNINMFCKNVPNLKLNLVLDEDYQGEYLQVIRQVMREIKEKTDLKHVNILIADHLYRDEFKLLRLLGTDLFNFVIELDENFTYKNCMWDNTRKSLTEMMSDVKENIALKLAGKEFRIPYEYEFAQINFLESTEGMRIEDNVDDTPKRYVIPFEEFDSYVEKIKPTIQRKPLRKIKTLQSVGII